MECSSRGELIITVTSVIIWWFNIIQYQNIYSIPILWVNYMKVFSGSL